MNGFLPSRQRMLKLTKPLFLMTSAAISVLERNGKGRAKAEFNMTSLEFGARIGPQIGFPNHRRSS